jgi:hypothetical protein
MGSTEFPREAKEVVFSKQLSDLTRKWTIDIQWMIYHQGVARDEGHSLYMWTKPHNVVINCG